VEKKWKNNNNKRSNESPNNNEIPPPAKKIKKMKETDDAKDANLRQLSVELKLQNLQSIDAESRSAIESLKIFDSNFDLNLYGNFNKKLQICKVLST